MKTISILGCTGSIGKSSLNIAQNYADNITILAVSTHKNIPLLLTIMDTYNVEYAVVSDQEAYFDHFASYKITEYKGKKIYPGKEGLTKLCTDTRNDIILNAIAGKSGLFPSLEIVTAGIDLALANKESVVCAGPLLLEKARKAQCRILPVDSEHSALFSLLNNKKADDIENIILTASGGPFLHVDKKDWGSLTVAEALNHPTWEMGHKITIDSATMANKGLEVIEAHYLFNIDYDKINVLIHPQSLIHSMVETIDGEIYAQIGPKDMSLPVQTALFYPEMKRNSYNRLSLSKGITLELHPVDMNKFKMLDLAYYCGKKGGMFTPFYNFLNELLVHLFLKEEIGFLQIEQYMEKALELFEANQDLDKNTFSIENIINTEKETEQLLNRILK